MRAGQGHEQEPYEESSGPDSNKHLGTPGARFPQLFENYSRQVPREQLFGPEGASLGEVKLPDSDETSKITGMASDKDQTPGSPDEGSDKAAPARGGKGGDDRQGGGVNEESHEGTPSRRLSWWQRRREQRARRTEEGTDLPDPTGPDPPAVEDGAGKDGRTARPSDPFDAPDSPAEGTVRRQGPSGTRRSSSLPREETQAPDAHPGRGAEEPRSPPKTGGGQMAPRRVASLDDLADLADSELVDLPDPPPSVLRRLPWWAVLGALFLVLVVALVIVGEVDGQRYYLVCRGNAAEAHQGRSFPWPFGHSALGGPLYRPVPLHEEAQCEPQELDSEDQLQQSLLALLYAEAERRRTVTKLAELRLARRLLTQGFGLARGDKTWVGRLQALGAHFDLKEGIFLLREMETSLVEARRLLFRARHPRDAAKAGTTEDPELWIALVDHLLDRLRAGRAPSPREEIPLPVPIPSRDATAPTSAPRAPASSPGLVPPPVPLPEEPPRPAIPLLPDAGVKGGGILL